jgi:hypothetical protein
MKRDRLKLENRRGATLAVVAVSLVAMLAVMALAIDMGMMYSARNEAQRVADAAALSGASAFLDFYPASTAVAPAHARATEYVVANNVLSEMVDPSEANIEVDVANRRVRVTIARRQIGTWFARMFGVDSVAVSAYAVAEAVDAGAAKCVRPWAIQDLWHEGDTGQRPGEDDVYDPADPELDQYIPVTEPGQGNATGYGNTQADHGMELTLKTQRPANPNDSTELAQPGPGEFMIWEMPVDDTLEQCTNQGGSVTSPSYQYRNAICGCNQNSIELDVEYPIKTGNTAGPTDQGLEGLVAKDPDAYWDESTNTVVSQYGMESPRVVKIALMAPLGPPPDGAQNWNHSTLNTVKFTNFALMFVDSHQLINGQGGQIAEITGRFLYYAEGEEGPTSGSLVKFLRLIE